MAWYDPTTWFGPSGGSPYGSPLPSAGANPYASPFAYDPATIRRAAISNALLSAGAAMLGQGPSRTPQNFGTSIGQGVSAGIQGGEFGANQAMQRQQFAQQAALGGQQYQQGRIGVAGANLDLAQGVARYNKYWAEPGQQITFEQALNDPGTMAKVMSKVAPQAAQSAAPQTGIPDIPQLARYHDLMNQASQASIYGMPAQYVSNLQAQAEGDPDYKAYVASQTAGATAAGQYPYDISKIQAGKGLDVQYAGPIAYAGAKATDLAGQESLRQRQATTDQISSFYKDHPDNVEFQRATLALGTARSALSLPPGNASDKMLVQAAIQMAVPNAQLRGGSIDEINQITSLKDVAYKVKQAIASGSGLPDDVRASLQSFIQTKYAQINATHQQLQQSVLKRIGESGQQIDPQAVMPDYQSQAPIPANVKTLPQDAVPLKAGQKGYIPDGKQRYFSPSLNAVLTPN